MNPLLKALHPYRAKLDRDLVFSLHQQEKSAVIAHSLVAITLLMMLRSQVQPGPLVLWISAVIAVCFFRGFRAWRIHQEDTETLEPKQVKQWFWIHFATVASCGLAWSLGFVYVMPELDTTHRAIVVMVFSALGTGAVVTLSAHPATYLGFNVAVMAPAGIALALQPSSTERILAGLVFAAFVFGLASSKKARILLWSHLLQQYRNEEVVRDLAAAKVNIAESLQKSEAANQAKREFLTNMSHEVRTPMNGILGTAELLAGSDLKPDQVNLLSLLQQSGRDLMAILDDVLDLSKIESDRFDFVQEPFDLAEVLDDVATLHSMVAVEKGLEFIFDAPVDLPSKAIGDSGRLKQLIHNLLDNAVKFTERGAITFKIGLKAGGPSGALLVLEIRDQGSGIPQERMEAIFQSFTQADGSTTRMHGGTGLGLTITRRLVDLMDGRIELDSQHGVGTAFHIEIPLRFEEELRPASAKGNVLISAHPSNTIQAFARRLRKIGLTVRVPRPGAPIAEECRDFLKDGGWLMADPTLKGNRETMALQSHLHAGKAKLVILTANDSEESGELNVNQLASPFKIKAIRELIWSTDKFQTAAKSELETGIKSDSLMPMKILVAEDNPTNAKIAKRMLEQFGMEVNLASNGREAVSSFESQNPDLIFMDIQMPELDGMEATRLIRNMPGGQNIPILALTAHAMKGYRSKCLDAGMNDYYTKPLRKMDLQEALYKWQSLAQQRKSA